MTSPTSASSSSTARTCSIALANIEPTTLSSVLVDSPERDRSPALGDEHPDQLTASHRGHDDTALDADHAGHGHVMTRAHPVVDLPTDGLCVLLHPAQATDP